MSDDLRFLLAQRTTLVWLLLVVATCVSWWLGTGSNESGVEAARATATILLGVAFVKVRFVIRYFMEVRAAALPLRLCTDAWCVVVAGAVLALYWRG